MGPEAEEMARDRPEDFISGQTHRVQTHEGEMFVTVNVDEDGRPFEVFVDIGKSGGLAESIVEGLARQIALNLRTGTPLDEVIEQLDGIRGPQTVFYKGDQIRSIPDGIAHVLEEYKE